MESEPKMEANHVLFFFFLLFFFYFDAQNWSWRTDRNWWWPTARRPTRSCSSWKYTRPWTRNRRHRHCRRRRRRRRRRSSPFHCAERVPDAAPSSFFCLFVFFLFSCMEQIKINKMTRSFREKKENGLVFFSSFFFKLEIAHRASMELSIWAEPNLIIFLKLDWTRCY